MIFSCLHLVWVYFILSHLLVVACIVSVSMASGMSNGNFGPVSTARTQNRSGHLFFPGCSHTPFIDYLLSQCGTGSDLRPLTLSFRFDEFKPLTLLFGNALEQLSIVLLAFPGATSYNSAYGL